MLQRLESDPQLVSQQYYPKTQNQIYLQSFLKEAVHRWTRLNQSVLGNYRYRPLNQYSFDKKQKIFQYLKSKYIRIVCNAQQEKRRSFTSYDKNICNNVQFKSLEQMKDGLHRVKTNLEAAKETKMQLQASSRNLKGLFFNELAYEFDRQRYSSIGWGLVLGAFICSTAYRKGSLARRTALFLTCGHLCGQFSYHINLDKYFDTIYPIFLEDALEHAREQNLQDELNPRSDSAGIMED